MKIPPWILKLFLLLAIALGLLLGSPWLFTGYITPNMKGKAALKQAYQIHQALFAYAEGHDGHFPSNDYAGNSVTDSNTAFRQLFSADLIDTEDVFFVKGSAWHGKLTAPDLKIGTEETHFSEALSAGENHWSYVKNLTTDGDDINTPLLMDGGVLGHPGQWTADPTQLGGVWKGKFAITARTGGSVKVTDLGADLIVKDLKDGQLLDIFRAAYGTKPENCLNPLPPPP